MEIDFIVSTFGFGVPLTLGHPLQRKRYLSFSSKVEYSASEDKWLFERDEDDNICYIRRAVSTPYFQQYLGNPNSNNMLGLYTQKCPLTQWSIQKIEGHLLTIRYVGQKFNPNDVQLVVAADSTDDISWTVAYKDITQIYIGKRGQTYMTHILQNYGALKERLFFLDGKPFQTNPTIFCAIDNYARLTGVVPLGLYSCPKPGATTTTEFGLAYTTIKIMRDGAYAMDTGITDKVARTIQTTFKERYKSTGGMNVLEYFLIQAGLPQGGPAYNYTFESLMSVPRASIYQYPTDMYSRLLIILSGPNSDFNEQIFIRIWFHIILNEAPSVCRSTKPMPRSTTPLIRSSTPVREVHPIKHPFIPASTVIPVRPTSPSHIRPRAQSPSVVNRPVTPPIRPRIPSVSQR